MFLDDSMKVVLGGTFGTLLGAGLRGLPRYRETYVPPFQFRAMPWYYYAMMTVYLIVFVIAFPERDFLWWVFVAAAAISFVVTVWKLSKQHVQFSLRSMLLATLLVAMILSAGYYLTVTAVLASVTGLAMEWGMLEECRRLSLPPPQDRGEEVDPR